MSYYRYKNEDYDHYRIAKNDLHILDLLVVNFYNVKYKFTLLPKLVVDTNYEMQGSRWFVYTSIEFSWLWFSIWYDYKFDEESV